MFDSPKAEYIEESAYFGLSTNVIVKKTDDYRLKYLLGILNSSLAKYWFYKHGKKRGIGVDIGVNKLRIFPIKEADETQQDKIISIVDSILSSIKLGEQRKTEKYEKELDNLVYKLYDLTPEEIAIIENEV